MRRTIPLAFAAAVLAIGPGNAAMTSAAYAQAATAQPPEPTEVALTQTQIDNFIATQKDLAAAQGDKPPSDAGGNDAADAKSMEAIKKHGFASADEFFNVSYTVGLVVSGMDPDTKEFVGTAAMTRKQIQQINADKSMSPQDKKTALDQLNAFLKGPPPAKPSAANIAIVKANYDKLSELMQ